LLPPSGFSSLGWFRTCCPRLAVTYVLYADEGHGFVRPENNLSFYAITEAFLAQWLGGRYKPIGDDFQGSSIVVPVGAEEIPGLGEVLAG